MPVREGRAAGDISFRVGITHIVRLFERGTLKLNQPLHEIVPEFLQGEAPTSDKRSVTLRMLLAHSSGLPAWEPLYLACKTRTQLLTSRLQ